MIDVDDVLREELDRLVLPVEAAPDWGAVVAGSGLKKERVWFRAGAGTALVVAAAVLGLATPLGSALARGLDGFSAWLTGQPGTPASTSQQRAFDRSNARSWVAFPKGTRLRHLLTKEVGTVRVELLGFRSGANAFCLRLVVEGASRSTTQSCASLADVRLAGSPVRVVIADHPVGKGSKVAWYGTDRVHSANLQITAGITDDSVRSVTLDDDQGRHKVDARANAFLYVAAHPEVGQRVKTITARTRSGVVPVDFSPTPFGMGGGAQTAAAAPTVAVERHLRGGRIGWFDREELRGEPLSVLPTRLRHSLLGYRNGLRARTKVRFGRVLTPDPSVPMRVVVTANSNHAGGTVRGICMTVATASGAGGGCSPYPGIFDRSPVAVGSFGGGSGEYITAEGVASDDVDHLQAFMANNQRLPVPFVDNTFIVNLARAKLPARIVAYDRGGKIVGITDPISDFGAGSGGSPARGRAKQLLAVRGPGGAHSELLVGPSTTGGECMFVRHYVSAHVAGVMVGCSPRTWAGSALQLGTDSFPTRFVFGRVRPDVATVRLRYADGTEVTVAPRQGYVLQATAAAHLAAGHELVRADALDASGHLLAHQTFRTPPEPPKP